jgi:hypothetical protein
MVPSLELPHHGGVTAVPLLQQADLGCFSACLVEVEFLFGLPAV